GEQKDIPAHIATASVGVLPSYREGTPKTLLEFMSCGRPTIAADSPGCREPVIHKKTGFVTPVKNPEALAEAMFAFCETPGLIAEMGKEAHKYCAEKYESSKVVEQYLRAMGFMGL
ncbi:MAG: glycosyltransferase, partial [Firmicutes bacterium]|nr:glycosyltransferase [Bacillota bacterium]